MPTIDIKAIFDAEVDALKQIGISNLPEISGLVSTYLILNSERLNDLLATNDEEYIKERLPLEGDVIKAQLASFEVFGQMIAKDAQDKTVISIITTILTVLGQFLINKT